MSVIIPVLYTHSTVSAFGVQNGTICQKQNKSCCYAVKWLSLPLTHFLTVLPVVSRNGQVEMGGLLGPRAVRVSGTAETEYASGKPAV